jgi:hypothetical protein
LRSTKCPFEIIIAPKKERKKERKIRWWPNLQYKPQASQPVTITRAYLIHGGLCQPSRSKPIAVTKASSNYSCDLPQQALFTLCIHADSGTRLTKNIITATLFPDWPSKKISPRVIFLMCVWKWWDCSSSYIGQ